LGISALSRMKIKWRTETSFSHDVRSFVMISRTFTAFSSHPRQRDVVHLRLDLVHVPTDLFAAAARRRPAAIPRGSASSQHNLSIVRLKVTVADDDSALFVAVGIADGSSTPSPLSTELARGRTIYAFSSLSRYSMIASTTR